MGEIERTRDRERGRDRERERHWRIQRGGCGGCNPPPLNFQKIVVIRVSVARCDIFSCYFIKQCAFVCVCALNGVVIGYYTLGTAIFHYYFFSLAGPHDKQF